MPSNKPLRERPQVHFTLSTEAIAILDAAAAKWGRTRSQQVEEMARVLAFSERLDVSDLGKREKRRRNKFGGLRALEGKD